MADPITIVQVISASASLAMQCTQVAKCLHDLAGKYKNAKHSILSTAHELDIIRLAWERIEIALLSWEGLIQELDHNLVMEIRQKLEFGKLVIGSLAEDIEKFIKKPYNFGQRLRYVWSEETFKGHQDRIRGQVGAMTLLVSVLKLPSAFERAKFLETQESVNILQKSDESAYSIVPSRLSSRLSSIRDSKGRLSVESAELVYQQLSIDDDLFTARVYKRNYRPQAIQTYNRSYIPFPKPGENTCATITSDEEEKEPPANLEVGLENTCATITVNEEEKKSQTSLEVGLENTCATITADEEEKEPQANLEVGLPIDPSDHVSPSYKMIRLSQLCITYSHPQRCKSTWIRRHLYKGYFLTPFEIRGPSVSEDLVHFEPHRQYHRRMQRSVMICHKRDLELLLMKLQGAHYCWKKAYMLEACRQDRLELVSLLLDHFPKIYKDATPMSWYHYVHVESIKTAYAAGSVQLLRILCTKGPKNRHTDSVVEDLLEVACTSGQSDLLECLMSYGLQLKDDLLEVACINGRVDILECLMLYGLQPKDQLLKTACMSGQADVAKCLISHGLPLRDELLSDELHFFPGFPLRDELLFDELHFFAVWKSDRRVLLRLLKNGISPNARSASGETCLHKLVRESSYVGLLTTHGHLKADGESKNTTTGNGSNVASPADLSLNWPTDELIAWLDLHVFSKEWQETFKVLRIEGFDLLGFYHSTSENSTRKGLAHVIYPQLVRECEKSGLGWDPYREFPEGSRLQRLVESTLKDAELAFGHLEHASSRNDEDPFSGHVKNLEESCYGPMLSYVQSSKKIALALLNYGADITATDANGDNIFHYAASVGDLRTMHFLRSLDIDRASVHQALAAKNNYGYTPSDLVSSRSEWLKATFHSLYDEE